MSWSLIVAYSSNRVIGRSNQLIWHISDDLKRFKRLTLDHHIIMGRKSYDSIGRALSKRINVVITRDKSFSADNVIVTHSLKEAINCVKNDSEPFIVGGGETYRQALEFGLVQKVYATEIHKNFEGDTYFPELGPEWKVQQREEIKSDKTVDFSYSYVNYELK